MNVGVSLGALRSGVSILALTMGVLWTTESWAQNAAADSSEVSELLVTARKREENLQDVPVAIAAFTAQELQKGGVTTIENLAAATPGLTAQTLGGTYQAPVIRGLAQIDQTAPIGNVGVFVDGIYLNNRSGQEFGFMDIERIEVVKGPQSALYGRNTFSGAINYVTKSPHLNDYDGYVTGELGSHERASLQGSVNLPLGEVAAIRLFGGRGKFDGTIKNIRDNGYLGGWENKSTYGGALIFEPHEDVTFRAFYTRSDTNADQAAFVFLPTTTNNCGSQAIGPNGFRYTLICGKLPYPKVVDVLSSPAHGLKGFNAVGYMSIDYDMHFATLTGTFGYTNARFAQLNDQTARASAINTPLAPGSPFSQQTFLEAVGRGSEEFSYDLRLTSPDEGPFKWMAGLYYFDSVVEDNLSSFNTPLGDLNTRVLSFGRGGEMSIIGRAVYAQATWDVTDRITLGAEGRYSIEDQKFRITLVNSPVKGAQDYAYFTPKFTIAYKITDDMNVYASAAKGYKIGGFNSNAFGLPQFTFGPEDNWSYELGFKATLLDGKLNVDTAIYYIDWNGIQVQSNIPASTVAVVINNKGATSLGWEWNSVYHFTPNLWVRGAFTILDPKYKDGTRDGEVFAPCGELPGTTILVKGCSSLVGGNQLSRTSNRQFAITGDWTLPELIGGFDGYVRGDYSWQAGKSYLSLNNDDQGDIDLLNLRFGLRNDNIDVAVWVNNALDKEYLARSTSTSAGVADGAPGTGVLATRLYPGELRTYGVRLTYRF